MNLKSFSIKSLAAAIILGSMPLLAEEEPVTREAVETASFQMPAGTDGWRQITIIAPHDTTAEVELWEIDQFGFKSLLDRVVLEPNQTYVNTIGADDSTSRVEIQASLPVYVTSTAGALGEPTDDSTDMTPSPEARKAAKATWCWCTNYLGNRFGLTGYPDAGRWDNGYLKSKGWSNSSEPKQGYIAVFEANAYGMGTYGHVAGIDKRESLDSKKWKLTLRGANQPGSTFTEYNCTDVTKWVVTVKKGDANVSYWKK